MFRPSHGASLVVVEGGEPIASLHHPDGVFIGVGIEHSSAPLEVRERVSLRGEALEEAHRTLIGQTAIVEVAILSTCNRTELYLFARDPFAAAEAAIGYLLGLHPAVRPYVRTWEESSAAEHLLRVAAGLESRVLGEHQILSQVRESLAHADRLSTAGPYLHRLFQAAIACGRHVRQKTGLGRVDASIATETVRAAEDVTGPLNGRTALVIGGGEVSRLTAAELQRRHIGRLYLANRTVAVAEELAGRYGGIALPLADIPQYLPSVDIVVSATSAPRRILTVEDVRAADLSGRGQPLYLFDLAMPRDIDPAIGDMPGAVLRDLDSLIPSSKHEQRADDVGTAEFIVRDHLGQLERWYRTRRVTPLIAQLRQQIDEVEAGELERAASRLAVMSQADREAVQLLSHRLSSAIFHRLVTRLASCADDRQLIQAAAYFFGSEAERTDEPVAIGALSLSRAADNGGETQ